MRWALLRGLLALPGMVVGVIPAIILTATRESRYAAVWLSAADWRLAAALLAGVGGLTLAVWTVTLFVRVGRGTPAPWEPPQNLVIRGPYRHVRNPMISGVILILSAESIFSQSWPLAAWTTTFTLLNALYLPLVEEKQLEKRFGDAYRQYTAHVPRWAPRLRPWTPEA